MTSATVRDAMSAAQPCVSDADTLMAAAQKMASFGFAAVAAVDSGNRPLGVVTQRDLVLKIANGANLSSVAVGEVATDSYLVAPDDPLDAAARLLGTSGLPMLPVVEGDQLVGLISAIDVAAQRRLDTALGADVAALVTEISPSDGMYTGSRGSYVTAGASALECISRAMRLIEYPIPQRILDLPCGHGRILRMLKAAFPDAHLTASDLERDGVDFCARVLGAEPVYSASDPDEIALSGSFDLIWCGSLFTHFDKHRWPGFLDFLGRNLTPGGLLVLTTHGRHPAHALRGMGVSDQGVVEMFQGYDEIGIGYSATPYELEKDWGLAIASPDWIRAQVDPQPNLTLIRHEERAWEPPAPRQDVVICQRPKP